MVANERSLARALDNYPEKYRPCRLRGHAYVDEPRIFRYRDEVVGIRIVLRFTCNTCGYIREDFYTRHGEREFSRPTYPEGYLVRYTEEEKEKGLTFSRRNVARYEVKKAIKSGIEEYPIVNEPDS